MGRCILKPRGDCARLSGGHIDVKKRRKESSLKNATPPPRLTSDLFSSSASTPRRRGPVIGKSDRKFNLPVVGVLCGMPDRRAAPGDVSAPGGPTCRALLRDALLLQDLPHLLRRDRDALVRDLAMGQSVGLPMTLSFTRRLSRTTLPGLLPTVPPTSIPSSRMTSTITLPLGAALHPAY